MPIRLRKGVFTERQLRRAIRSAEKSLKEDKTELLACEQWMQEAEVEYNELEGVVETKKKFLRALRSKLTRLQNKAS